MVRLFLCCGAGGRSRTGTELPPLDFESSASANFTTLANLIALYYDIKSFIQLQLLLVNF